MGQLSIQDLLNTVFRPTTIVHGKKTVTTAGSRVALVASSTPLKACVVQVKALAANTGKIYVGGSTVASTNGYELSAGEFVTVMTDDAANIYIDSAVNGEGVTFLGA